MADLSKNSLWGDISNKTSNLETDIVGPSYSYSDHIPTPDSLGVGSNGTFSQLGTNSSAIVRYADELIGGDALGNQFFVNTGGTCNAPDGSIQPRYNYVNNVSSGLIPGILEDIGGLNPLYLFNSLISDGTPSCECYTCQTSDGLKSYFLNTDLTPDFSTSLCTKVDPSICAGKESFTNKSDSKLPFFIALGLLGILIVLRKN
jgi:hypothetical protein